MTVSTQNIFDSYVGDGIEVTFTITFQVESATWIEAYIDDVLYVGDKTITLNTDQDTMPGGSFTFVAFIPPDTSEIRLERVVPLTQLTDYQPYTPFPAESHEDALDKLTMITQQLNLPVENLLNAKLLADSAEELIIDPGTAGVDNLFTLITNVPYGLAKLDDMGWVPSANLPPALGGDFRSDGSVPMTGTIVSDLTEGNVFEADSFYIDVSGDETRLGTYVAGIPSTNITVGSGDELWMSVIQGGVLQSEIELDGTQINLYADGSKIAGSIAPSSGGFEVNNTLTGAGLERVLTQSDITGMGGNFFPGIDPNLTDTGAALLVGGVVADTDPHIEVGPTAIQAKADLNSARRLNLNPYGFPVQVGGELDDRGLEFTFSSNLGTSTIACAGVNSNPSIQLQPESAITFGVDASRFYYFRDPNILRFSCEATHTVIQQYNAADSNLLRLTDPNGDVITQYGYASSLTHVILEVTEESMDFALRCNVASDTIVEMLYVDATAETVSIRNTTTGAGLERALTTSDQSLQVNFLDSDSIANYTLLAADLGKSFFVIGSGAFTLTIPAGLPVGFWVNITNQSSNTITTVEAANTDLRVPAGGTSSFPTDGYGTFGVYSDSGGTTFYQLWGLTV